MKNKLPEEANGYDNNGNPIKYGISNKSTQEKPVERVSNKTRSTEEEWKEKKLTLDLVSKNKKKDTKDWKKEFDELTSDLFGLGKLYTWNDREKKLKSWISSKRAEWIAEEREKTLKEIEEAIYRIKNGTF